MRVACCVCLSNAIDYYRLHDYTPNQKQGRPSTGTSCVCKEWGGQPSSRRRSSRVDVRERIWMEVLRGDLLIDGVKRVGVVGTYKVL